MSDNKHFDCYMEMRLIVQRKVRIAAPSLGDAQRQADSLAAAWMPAELLAPPDVKAFPATRNPAIVVETTVIRAPERADGRPIPIDGHEITTENISHAA